MESLLVQDYFDLTSFAHSSLFSSCRYVFEALTKISSYLEQLPLGKIEGKVEEGAFLINPHLIFIGKGSFVEPGAYIKGPAFIGSHCTIRHGAYIRGNLITGDHCVLGHDSEFKNSILLDHAHAAHFAYVGDSILGNRTNLGAGTILANLKLNRGLISVRTKESTIETGLKKCGAIVGDGSQIGCNSVVNPGTLLGKEVLCYPCSNFGGIIPSFYQVRPEVKVSISKK